MHVAQVSCCEHGDEPSGSIKGRDFIELLNGYQVLKKDSAPWSR